MQRLKGKIALVTGAAQGTGAAIARHFVAEGARVVLTDVQDEIGADLTKKLGGQARYIHLDVCSEDDWQRAIELTKKEFGPPSVLVNNAALLHLGPLETTTREIMDRVIGVNQIGPLLGIKAVLPSMKELGMGSIVNIGSIDGVMPGNHGIIAYSSSKWGLRGITKVAAMELGQYSIRVNIVNPDSGNPLMSRPFVPESVSDDQIKLGAKAYSSQTLTPTFDKQRVDEIASMVLFLASDESSACSGGDYPVDGGYTAGHMTNANS